MRLTVGGVERRARVTDTFRANVTQANFACTVAAADFDADGIAIPANSIAGGGGGQCRDRGQAGAASRRGEPRPACEHEPESESRWTSNPWPATSAPCSRPAARRWR